MAILLVVVAVFLALFGAANLSPATLGVGVIGVACLMGILARVAQAAAHRQEQVDIAARGSHRDVVAQSHVE